jgi:hypothetical protein
MRNRDELIRSILDKAAAIEPPPELKGKVMQLVLRGASGNPVSAIRVDSWDESDPMDRILQQLKPGMGIAVYIAGTADGAVSQQTCYKPVEWTGSLNGLLAAASPYDPRLPAGAELIRASVMYGFDNLTDDEIAEMIERSEHTGQRVVVRDLVPNDRLVGAQLDYTYGGQSFEYHILTTTKSRIHVPDIQDHRIERVAVNGQEGLYLSDGYQNQLIWVEEDSASGYPLQYEIRARQAEKEWLLAIAGLCTIR